MISDVAVIGIEIKTTGSDRAKKSLDDLAGSGKRAEASVTGLQGASERTQKSLASLGAVAAGAAATMGVGELIRLSDQYTKYTAQLKLATTNTAAYAEAMNQVRAISTTAQQDIGAVGTLYARISNSTRELGLSQQRMAAITETVSLSLKVSGAASSESASAMLQLSQAFTSGVLRGEEFNAVNEAAPRLMKALADGIGVPIGALREMAAEGKITSEVMANALPRALNELREEAKSVQTIAGSFTVLKNNVLEFVGVQSQASGAVSVLTAGIDSLARNLDLITAAAGGLAVAKLADVLIGAAAATARGVSGTIMYADALTAQRAASIAAAQAEVGSTAAMIARMSATQAAVVVSREEYAAKLAAANATIAISQASLQQAAATIASSSASLQAAKSAGALSFALATARESTVALAGAQSVQAAATAALAAAEKMRVASLAELAILGRQQVSVSAQVTAAAAAQTAAQTALATATAAGGAASGLAVRALGFLGGPIGVITTLLGLGATAWMLWGGASKSAQTAASDAVEQSTADIIANLDKQNAKLRERIELGKQLGLSLGQEPSEAQKRRSDLGKQIDDLQAGRGINGGAPLPEAARVALMQTLLRQYGQLESKIDEGARIKGEDAATKSGNALIEVRMRMAGINKQYFEDLQAYQAALKAGAISEKQYIEEVSALAKSTYESSTAGKAAKAEGKADNSAAKAALAAAKKAEEDALQARVEVYRNADKAVLDSRQDFYTALSYEVKLGEMESIKALGAGVDKEFEVWMQRSALLDLELSAIAKKKDTQKEQAVILGKLADLERDYSQAATKASNEIKVAVRDQTIAYQEAEDAARSYLANITSQNSRDLAGLGMGNLQRDQDGRRNQRDDQYQGRKDQLAAQRRANEISPEVYAERLALEATTHAQVLAADEAYWARRKELQADWSLGASEALRNYAGESANVFRQTESLVTNAFTGMEDALVKFATTGKLSFSDLAKSIIADMIRIQARAAMSSALSSIFGAFTGSAGVGSAGNAGYGDYSSSGLAAAFGSRAEGGYTGPGGKYEPAGVVHRGEVVWSQENVRKAGGVGVVEAMRLGKPGLSSGGIVGPQPAFYKPSAAATSGVVVNIHNNGNSQVEQTSRRGSDGEQIIDVFINQAVNKVAGQLASNSGPVGQAMRARSKMGM